MSVQLGVYKWSYAGGEFSVALRPNGIFYCGSFPASSTWHVQGTTLVVDWKKYGVYEFALTGAATLDGHAANAPANWRKLQFVRAFNQTEQVLIANGFGSAWDFGWEKGSFEVEFRIDGYNHFVCKQYPAHSHWDLDESGLLTVNWGQYGVYELRLDANGELVGSAKGAPTNWRKARFLHALTAEVMSEHSHDHSHEDHVHSDSCGQGHEHKKDSCCSHGKKCDHSH